MDIEDIRLKLDPILREAGLREVARRAGIAQPTITTWLNGKTPMSLSTIQKVADAVGYELKTKHNLKRKRS